MGRDLPLKPNPQAPFSLAAAQQGGTMYCNYGDQTTYFFVVGETHPVVDSRATPRCDTVSRSCAGGTQVDGMQLRVHASYPSGKTVQPAFVALLTELTSLVGDRGRPVDWTPQVGAAPAIFDCQQLASVDMAGAMGSGALKLFDTTNWEEGTEDVPSRESVAYSGRSECMWSGGETIVQVQVLSGGAWFVDDPIGAGLEPATIAGADRVYRQCVDSRPCGFVAIVGLDALEITAGGDYYTTMTEDDARAAAEVVIPAYAAL
jgi:hypothetical protein